MKPLTREDRVKWRQFLNSPAGSKGLQYIEERHPAIYKDDYSHNVILAAGEQNGHAIAVSQLRDLQNFEDSPEADDQLPPLEANRTR